MLKQFFCLTFAACLLLLFPSRSTAQDLSEGDFIIWSTKEHKKVELKEIIKEAKNYHVVFFGEEHNDSIAHRLQHMLLMELHAKYKDVALSMEQFDRDVQYILDEYLQGLIKQSYFEKDSRKWSNYKDYRPMVEFCKSNGLKVIAANAPFRYVNIVANQGLAQLMKLSPQAKEAMAPLPYDTATGDYHAKLMAMMSHDDGSGMKMTYNIIMGQSLWDATMAYSVYQHLKANPKSKVLHLNGRFHTDERYGIIMRLAGFDPKISSLVISNVGDAESYPDVKFADYEHLADYVIFTNPAVKKSY